MLKTYFKSYKAKDWVVLALAAVVLSTCGVIGASYEKTYLGPSMPPLEILLYIGAGIVAFAIMLVAFDLVLDLIVGRKAKATAKAPTGIAATHASGIAATESITSAAATPRRFITLNGITPSWSVKSIIIFAAIMLALWSPWIVAYFPAP